MNQDLHPQPGDHWQRAGQPDIAVTDTEGSTVVFKQEDRTYRVTMQEYLRLAEGCRQKGDTFVRKDQTKDFLFE